MMVQQSDQGSVFASRGIRANNDVSKLFIIQDFGEATIA